MSDIRRKTDIEFFKNENFNIKTIRIEANDDVRQSRGWKFQQGVDDVQSECDLDDYANWDFILNNNGASLDDFLEQLNRLVQEIVSKESL